MSAERDIKKIYKIFRKYNNTQIDNIIAGVDKLFEMEYIANQVDENIIDDIDKLEVKMEKEIKEEKEKK